MINNITVKDFNHYSQFKSLDITLAHSQKQVYIDLSVISLVTHEFVFFY